MVQVQVVYHVDLHVLTVTVAGVLSDYILV